MEKVREHFLKKARNGIVLTYQDLAAYCRKRKVKFSARRLRDMRRTWKFVAIFSKPRKPPHYMGMAVHRYGVLQVDMAEYGWVKEAVTRSVSTRRRPWDDAEPRLKKSYFLVGVECLSQKLSCVPCRDKSSASWESAITFMLEQVYGDIRCVMSDRDGVATSKSFRLGLLEKHGVKWRFLRTRSKAHKAERMIRFLKERLSIAGGGEKGEEGRKDWRKLLPGLLDDYNSRKIPGTGVVRKSVTKDNFLDLLSEIYKSDDPSALFNISAGSNVTRETGKALWRIEVGQKVLVDRTANYKDAKKTFDKPSVTGAFGKKVYTVSGRGWKNNADLFLCPIYRLEGLKGGFYETELLPVKFQV